MMLRQTGRIVMGISAWALLVALPSLAQGPGLRGWARHYNPATEVRTKGTVEEVRQVGRYRSGSGTHLSDHLKTGHTFITSKPANEASRRTEVLFYHGTLLRATNHRQ